ncbi:MAG: hypothetical protein JNL96_00755 [Planctomycetaceae bacterium]|nr:hypothetical protein [Planctomycetaceae bacterium]
MTFLRNLIRQWINGLPALKDKLQAASDAKNLDLKIEQDGSELQVRKYGSLVAKFTKSEDRIFVTYWLTDRPKMLTRDTAEVVESLLKEVDDIG